MAVLNTFKIEETVGNMKRFALSLLVLSACLAACTQGTVQFSNLDTSAGLNAPIFLNDGTTLAGTGFTAVLLAGPSPSSLQQIATTPLLTGSQLGYFQGGGQSIPTVPGGSNAFVAIGVFDSVGFSSFRDAYIAGKTSGPPNAYGLSTTFSVTTGGDTNVIPATAPAVLIGLQSFILNGGYLPALDGPPVIFQTYDPVTRNITVSFNHTLQVSTDLIHWTKVITNWNGSQSPQVFPATQAQQYFRANYP